MASPTISTEEEKRIDLVNDTFTYTFLFVFAVTFVKTSSVRYIAFRTQSWMIKQT